MPKAAENANATTAALAVIAALALWGIWFTSPTLADTESQKYAAIEAFQTTDASRGQNCRDMITVANGIASPASEIRLPAGFVTLAAMASLCLGDVRRETPDELPARIPMSFLVLSCGKIRPGLKSGALKGFFSDSVLKNVTQMCAGVP